MKALLSVLFIGMSLFLLAEEGVCKSCQKIRDYNAAHPENNYYWYEDYLKEKGQQLDSPSKVDSDSPSQ